MKPIILAHRGWWKTPEEQNTLAAFERAWERGWGVELDVRDWNGHLVVSHDPVVNWVQTDGEVTLPVMFTYILDRLGVLPNVLAVNVKSCGLAPWFAGLKAPKNWFFYGTEFYDQLEYTRLGLPGGRVLRSSELFGNDPLPGWEQLRAADVAPSYPVHLLTDRPDEAEEFFK